jgi:hypothetical protein
MADIDKQWREILNRLNKVKKNVDDNYRASKKFFGSYDELVTFMTEAEKQLESEDSIGADPAALKHQLKKHKVNFHFSCFTNFIKTFSSIQVEIRQTEVSRPLVNTQKCTSCNKPAADL